MLSGTNWARDYCCRRHCPATSLLPAITVTFYATLIIGEASGRGRMGTPLIEPQSSKHNLYARQDDAAVSEGDNGTEVL